MHNEGGLFDGLKQEDFAGVPFAGDRDSWVTIGSDVFAGNDTNYSTGFLGNDGATRVIDGPFLELSNDGWYDSDLNDTPELPDENGRTLIAQFAFEGDLEFVTFQGNAWWRPSKFGSVVITPFRVQVDADCVGDMDYDAIVTFTDVIRLLASWGECPPGCCPGDFDGSGDVGLADLMVTLSRFGGGCLP
jgi:hypothetical protein